MKYYIILLVLFQVNNIISQNTPLTDVSYRIINVNNGGFLTVCTKPGSCKESDWMPVCFGGNSNAQNVLQTAVCRKYGYDDGKLFMSAQSACFLVTCPSPTSDLTLCTGYISSNAQTTLYVVCYSGKCSDIAEPITGGSSVNCDFENGDSCGWQLQNFFVQSGVDPDHTVGSRYAHYLTSPKYCTNNITYSVAVSDITVGCDSCQQYYCFTFYAMNIGDQPTVVISAVYSPTENITLFTKSTPFNQAYTSYTVHVEVTKPFRLAVTTWCTFNRTSTLYLDDFILTAGKCPNEQSGTCYNNGVLNSNGDSCQCPSDALGRACELSFCNTSSKCDCPTKVNWVIIGAIIGGFILLLAAVIIAIIIIRKCFKSA